MTPQPEPNVAERLERDLALRILRGEFRPGSRLPSVRVLATELEVTTPTVQRVIARLEANGLVRAKRGSGVEVLDVDRHGDLSLVPLWFEALTDQPDRASQVLAECMELRRMLTTQLMTRMAEVADVEALAPLIGDVMVAETVEARMDADLAFSRATLELVDHFAARALFNTVERVIRTVPGVAEAFYGDAALHRKTLAALLDAFRRRQPADAIAALEAWDEASVARFRAARTG